MKLRSNPWTIGCLVLMAAVPSGADQYTVTISNRISLLASPFESGSGRDIPYSSFFVVPTNLNSFIVSKWDAAGQWFITASYTASSGGWYGTDGTNTVSRGQAFFVGLGGSETNYPYDMTFSGVLVSNAIDVITIPDGQPGLHMLGYPYLTSVALADLNLTNIQDYVFGHAVSVYIPEDDAYDEYFYDAGGVLGGGWQEFDDPGYPVSRVLAPMEGFIIRTYNPTSVVWQVSRP